MIFMCRPCFTGDTKSEYKKCWLTVEEHDQKQSDELTDHSDMTKNWLKPKSNSNTTTMSVPNDLGGGGGHWGALIAILNINKKCHSHMPNAPKGIGLA